MGDFISIETQRKAMETKPDGMTDDQVIQGFLDAGDQLEGLNYEFFPVGTVAGLPNPVDIAKNVGSIGLNFLSDTVDIAKGIWALTKDQEREQSFGERLLSAPAVGLTNFGKGLFDLWEGMTQLGITTLTEREIRNRPDKRAVAKTIINDYQQAYGSVEKFLNTVEEHPGRLFGDISLITGVAAGVTPAKLATKLRTLSLATDPLSVPFRVAGKLTKTRKIAPFAGSVDQELARIAEARGVELTAGSLSESPAVAMTEKIAGRGFFGAKIIKKVEASTEKVNRLANDLVGTAGTADKTIIGKNIVKGFSSFKKSFREVKNALYKRAELPKTENFTAPKVAKLRLDSIGDTDFIQYFDDGNLKTIAAVPRRPGNERNMRQIAEADGFATNDVGDVLIGQIQKRRMSLPVEAPNTRNFVKGMLEAEKEAAKITGKQRNVKLFEKLNKALSEGQEARTVRDAIKQIDDMIDFKSPLAVGNQAILKRIRGSLANELDNAVKEFRPDLANAIDEANALYATNVEKLQSVWAKRINRLKNQPDKIVESIINPRTSVEDIPNIFQVVGESNIPDIQAFVLDDIFTRARSTTTKEFEIAGLTREIKRYGEGKLARILTAEQFDVLLDLETLSRGLARGRTVVEGANVAFASRVAIELGIAFGGNVPLAIKAFLGDLIGSRFIGSKVGQALLTTGLEVKLGSIGAKARAVGDALQRARSATQTTRILNSEGLEDVDNSQADVIADAQDELDRRPGINEGIIQ